MKRLSRLARGFFLAAVAGAAVSAAVIVMRPPDWIPAATLSVSAALVTGLLYWRTRKRIATARLIIENQILHIQPAVFLERGRGAKTAFHAGEFMEVFVSCFGILLDSRIIKFNQEGIRLKAVELGRNFITLTYGTENKTQSIKLLHEEIGQDAFLEIARRFRYETGVNPEIAD